MRVESGVHTIPKDVGPKWSTIMRLEFKLADYDVAFKHINHYAISTPLLPPLIWGLVYMSFEKFSLIICDFSNFAVFTIVTSMNTNNVIWTLEMETHQVGISDLNR